MLFRSKYAAHGVSPLVMTADETRAFIDAEIEKWVRLAREAKIQPE